MSNQKTKLTLEERTLEEMTLEEKRKSFIFESKHLVDPVSKKDLLGITSIFSRIEPYVHYLTHFKGYVKWNSRPSQGIAFFGPLGTGKTSLAKLIANESKARYIPVENFPLQEDGMWTREAVQSLCSLLRHYVASNESNRGVVACFDEVRNALKDTKHLPPQQSEAVLQFIREIDGMAGRNANDGILWVITTTQQSELEQGLLRPGRIGDHIETYPPDIYGKIDLITKLLQNYAQEHNPVCFSEDLDLNSVANLFLREDPQAKVDAVCREAKNLAVMRFIRQQKKSPNEPNTLKPLITDVDFINILIKGIIGDSKEYKLSEKTLRLVCLHEAGHAIIQRKTNHPCYLVYIGLTGKIYGAVDTIDHYKEITYVQDLFDYICTDLGGKVIEELFRIESVGYETDLHQATDRARRLVDSLGKGNRTGLVSLDSLRAYRPHTEGYSDLVNYNSVLDIKEILEEQQKRAKMILEDFGKNNIEKLADYFLNQKIVLQKKLDNAIKHLKGEDYLN